MDNKYVNLERLKEVEYYKKNDKLYFDYDLVINLLTEA